MRSVAEVRRSVLNSRDATHAGSCARELPWHSSSASDLEFILEQIRIAEAHAAGTPLQQLIANPTLSLGLRTVDGSYNNLVQGQSEFGAADKLFPRMTTPDFRDAEGGTSYEQTSGMVADSQPARSAT